MSRPTLTGIQQEQKELEEMQDMIDQRMVSLKSMLARYLEVQNNDKPKN